MLPFLFKLKCCGIEILFFYSQHCALYFLLCVPIANKFHLKRIRIFWWIKPSLAHSNIHESHIFSKCNWLLKTIGCIIICSRIHCAPISRFSCAYAQLNAIRKKDILKCQLAHSLDFANLLCENSYKLRLETISENIENDKKNTAVHFEYVKIKDFVFFFGNLSVLWSLILRRRK